MSSATPFVILQDARKRRRTHPHEGFNGAKELEAKLRSTVTGEVRFDETSRALYVTDASHYRQVPIEMQSGVLDRHRRPIDPATDRFGDRIPIPQIDSATGYLFPMTGLQCGRAANRGTKREIRRQLYGSSCALRQNETVNY
jgi:hypothetical protein